MQGRPSETVRVARLDKSERQAILLLTPEERKLALLCAGRRLLALLSRSTRNVA